jgi:hypothetical protein
VNSFQKILSIIVLLASTGLTNFQIADAAEDTLEDITAGLQITSLHHPIIASPATPDDDDDANIPNIANQFLLPAPIYICLSPHFMSLPSFQFGLLPFTSVDVALRDLSPPDSTAANDDLLAHRQRQYASFRRTLAPPLA